ncbi:MAG TPA: transposase [Candidatus Acidoferrales bacterium]|nr:transposase [Candidatus Acidoferrales bacterium]
MQRTAEEKWGIVQEGIKSGNISETCRRYGIAPTLFYRWKDEAEQGAKAALGGEALARQARLSGPTVRDRLHRLEQKGVLSFYGPPLRSYACCPRPPSGHSIPEPAIFPSAFRFYPPPSSPPPSLSTT